MRACCCWPSGCRSSRGCGRGRSGLPAEPGGGSSPALPADAPCSIAAARWSRFPGPERPLSDSIAPLAAALADRYAIRRELGSGGMATVYLATDLKHDREVALKVLRPELTAILGAERFLNEIRITARLDHPHILTLIDSGADEGLLWYVVPYIRGESLRQRLAQERQLGLDEAVGITRQVADALDYAHRQGVIHRDIKPENILLQEGHAILGDFGIALALREAGGNRLTETGLSLGTPQYMSPEQATGDRALDARSDVYSLGAVLYEMLTGEPPHTGATVQAVIAKLMTERPTPVRTVRDTVPPALEAAVTRALAKVPADRFPTAASFATALASATAEPPSRPAAAAAGRWRLPAALAVAALAAVGWWATSRRAGGPSGRTLAEPTRTQFTFSGDVRAATISPDGQRLAFTTRRCDQSGRCTQAMAVQDIRGAGAQTLLEGWAGIYYVQWSPDGRWLMVLGTAPSQQYGAFVLPSLGGPPRFLGPEATFLGHPDTVLINPSPDARTKDAIWLVATTHDGVVRDTIRVQPDGVPMGFLLGAPGGQAVLTGGQVNGELELRVVGRDGSIRDRRRFPAWAIQLAAWESPGSLLVSLRESRRDGSVFLNRQRLEPGTGRFDGPPERLFRLGDDITGWFSHSPATGTIAMIRTSQVIRVHALLRDSATNLLRPVRLLGTYTGQVAAQVAPSGRWIALRSRAAGSTTPRDQVALHPWDGGAEVMLIPPTDSLNAFEWAPDRDRLHYTVPDGSQLAIHEVDAETRQSRRVGTLPARFGTVRDFEPLQEGGHAWIVDGDPALHWQVPGQAPQRLELPTTSLFFTSSSPAGHGLALMGWNQPGGDSLHIMVMDSLGRPPRIVWAGVLEGAAAAWLPDGTLYGLLGETQSTRGAYSIHLDGRPAVRHGLAPFSEGTYRIATDGVRGSVVEREERTDAWLVSGWRE